MTNSVSQRGYVIIRYHDGVIMTRLPLFPECAWALMYRRGDVASFVPLQDDEIIGTPTLFIEMLERAGYRATRDSDRLSS